MPIITYSIHDVVIEGVRIPRPARIAPSQWLRFWERVLPKPKVEY